MRLYLGRREMNTYPKALDVKIEIEGLDDHCSSFTQWKPTRRAQLLPTYRPKLQNICHNKMFRLESLVKHTNMQPHAKKKKK